MSEEPKLFDTVTIWVKTVDVEEYLKDLRKAGFRAEISTTECNLRVADDQIEISPIEIHDDPDATKINLWMRERERRRGTN